MAKYQYKGEGHGLPMSYGNKCLLQKKIDIPAMIAAGAKSGLALPSAPDTGVALPSTGFGATDVLEVFKVPKGTIVNGIGFYVITGQGVACTIDVGVTSATQTEDGADADGWLNDGSIQTAGVTGATADNLGFGHDNVPGGELYIADGSIDVTFNTAGTNKAVFVLWADVKWIDID